MIIDDNWYDDLIDEPVRDLVKILRNNGFNTTGSCGHEMNIEGDIVMDCELQRLHKIFKLRDTVNRVSRILSDRKYFSIFLSSI